MKTTKTIFLCVAMAAVAGCGWRTDTETAARAEADCETGVDSSGPSSGGIPTPSTWNAWRKNGTRSSSPSNCADLELGFVPDVCFQSALASQSVRFLSPQRNETGKPFRTTNHFSKTSTR